MRTELGDRGRGIGDGIVPAPSPIPRPLSPIRHSFWALPAQVVLQIVLLAGILVLNFFEGTDPDMWWHLAAGRYIVETGTIPQTDIFSYTAPGQPWVAHEWLAEIVMYLLYRAGGYLTEVVVFAALVALTYWIVLRILRLVGVGPVGSVLITAWVAAMSWASWNVRPQVFSYLFFALYLYLLLKDRQRPGRALWLLPAIMVAWVNLHAGYIMGILLIGLFGAGELLNRLAASRGDVETVFKRYLIVGVATVAATVVNPQGPAMLVYPFTYAGTQNASMRFIEEWQSPNFHNYYFLSFAAALLVLMAFRGRQKQDWAIAVPVLVLTAMTLQSVRVVAFFALAAGPYLALRLGLARAGRRGDGTGLEDNSSLITHHSSLRPNTQHPIPNTRSGGTPLNWVLLATCLAAMAIPIFVSDKAQVGPEPRTLGYPADGARYIREAGLSGNLFNTYHWGGYLAWAFYPERRIFVDGRADMYGDAFVEKYMGAYGAGPKWREVLDAHGVEVALIEKDGRLATLLEATGEWLEVFRGPEEVVLVRR